MSATVEANRLLSTPRRRAGHLDGRTRPGRAYRDLLDVPAARVRDRNVRVRRARVAARRRRASSASSPIVVVDEPSSPQRPELLATIAQAVRGDYVRAARLLGRLDVDVVLLQHEYGIFGGADGEYVLSLRAGAGAAARRDAAHGAVGADGASGARCSPRCATGGARDRDDRDRAAAARRRAARARPTRSASCRTARRRVLARRARSTRPSAARRGAVPAATSERSASCSRRSG